MKDSRYNLRYAMEHSVFPDMFFENPKQTILCLTHPELNYYFDVFKAFHEYNKEDFPYKPEEFSIERFKHQNILITLLKLPSPEQGPLCHRIYLLCDENFNNPKYYTIEKAANLFKEDKSPESEGPFAFLCNWDESHNHSNFGPLIFDNESMEQMLIIGHFETTLQ